MDVWFGIRPFWAGADAVVIEADAFKESDVIYRALSSRGHADMIKTAEFVRFFVSNSSLLPSLFCSAVLIVIKKYILGSNQVLVTLPVNIYIRTKTRNILPYDIFNIHKNV